MTRTHRNARRPMTSRLARANATLYRAAKQSATPALNNTGAATTPSAGDPQFPASPDAHEDTHVIGWNQECEADSRPLRTPEDGEGAYYVEQSHEHNA